MPSSSGPRLLRLTLLILTTALSGCAAYQLGNRTLFRPDIRTVYVPVFQSESLRRNLGERLTEAVLKEIEQRTPYKVVSTPDADSTLTGRIVRDGKAVVGRNQFRDARSIDTSIVVEVRWVDRRGELLMQRTAVPVPESLLTVGDAAHFIPEAGQSLATAQQQALQHLAQDIVGQMELWW
jgi:hypothetical protein